MQELLETTGNIATFRGSPNSVADCLLTWLDQLPDAVIPATLHDDALDAVQAGGLAGALSIVKQLTSEQKAAVYQVYPNSLRCSCNPITDTHRAVCVCAKMLRLCNSIAPTGVDPVRRWLQEHQRPLAATATVRRGAAGFGIVMNDAAVVCGGDGHTCDAIPLGAAVVQVGTVSVRDKADVIACIRSIPTDAEVQFTYRYNASAAVQEEQLHGVVQALRAAEMPSQIWVTELAGASLLLGPAVLFSRPIDSVQRLIVLCFYVGMEADGSLSQFLDAVASQAKLSGSDAARSSRPPSVAQLAEAIAPVLFRPTAQVRFCTR